MSTTKKGKLLNHQKPSPSKKRVAIWSIDGELGRLLVEYHMGHTHMHSELCVTLISSITAPHTTSGKVCEYAKSWPLKYA